MVLTLSTDEATETVDGGLSIASEPSLHDSEILEAMPADGDLDALPRPPSPRHSTFLVRGESELVDQATLISLNPNPDDGHHYVPWRGPYDPSERTPATLRLPTDDVHAALVVLPSTFGRSRRAERRRAVAVLVLVHVVVAAARWILLSRLGAVALADGGSCAADVAPPLRWTCLAVTAAVVSRELGETLALEEWVRRVVPTWDERVHRLIVDAVPGNTTDAPFQRYVRDDHDHDDDDDDRVVLRRPAVGYGRRRRAAIRALVLLPKFAFAVGALVAGGGFVATARDDADAIVRCAAVWFVVSRVDAILYESLTPDAFREWTRSNGETILCGGGGGGRGEGNASIWSSSSSRRRRLAHYTGTLFVFVSTASLCRLWCGRWY